MRGQRKGPSGCNPGRAQKPCGGRMQYTPSASVAHRLTRSEFLHDVIGRSITALVGLAAAVGSDRAVNGLLRAKDRHNRRGRG